MSDLLTLAEMMSRHTISVAPDCSLADATARMAERAISSLLVTETHDGGHVLRGIVTERDLLHALCTRRAPATPVAEIMSAPVLTAHHALDYREGYQLAASNGVRHLVVVDDAGEPIGIVTHTDFRQRLGLNTFLQPRPVATLMNPLLPLLPPEAMLEEALALMDKEHASAVVIAAEQRPLGIITERDAVRLYVAAVNSPGARVADAMSRPVLSIGIDESLAQAATRMLHARVRHLVVVDADGLLRGLLSEQDLVRPIGLAALDDAVLAAQDAEQRWIAALEAAGHGVWDWNLLSDRLYVSPAWLAHLGYDAADHSPDAWFALVHPEDAAGNRAAIDAHRAGATPTYSRHLRLRTAAGSWRWVQVQGSVYNRAADGRALRMVGTITDVTERRNVDEQHRRVRSNLDAVFAALTELVFVLDTDGRILHVNPAVTRLLGYAEAELIGRSALDTHPAALREEAHATLGAMLAGSVDSCQIPLLARDGTEVAVETRVSYGSWDNRPALIAVCRDIRARVAAERKVRQLSAAVEQSPLTVVITDTDGNIEYANPHFEVVTGYAREEALGRNPRFLKSGDTPLETYRTMWQTITAGRTWVGEIKNRRKDGSFYWERAVISPVLDGRGTITNYLAVKQDVTTQRAAEERLLLAASVFENAHEGIMITDPDGTIVEVNDAFTDLTGYGREEVLGAKPSLLQSGHQTAEFYATMWRALLRDGYWRGELWNRHKSGELFAELLTITAVRSAEGALSHFVAIFSDITQVKEHQQRLEYLAHYDPLTQLPNRTLLADRMQQALAHTLRSGDLLAVCYLDLDGFKPINDSYGHETGDQLLLEVANRLKGALRGGDTVARLGGDEFALLLGDLASIEEGEQVLTRLLALIAAPLSIAGKQLAVSASIGFTLFPLDHADPDTLLRHADQAMYAAKQSGRNRYHLFDTEHDRRIRSHREAFSRIEAALAAGEFLLYYQPKVDMRRGRVIGAEALIRWRHPQRGILPPAEFLPVIENTDLDIAIGEWVVEEALRQMEAWQAAGFAIKVSINISAHHLQGEHFTRHLDTQLRRHAAIAHGQLELEVLENAALQDMARVSQVIEECRVLGLTFSLDDFGTGYSSLTYFRRLPADTLKIDQSFVRDMLDDAEDLAIVEGVIGLTRAFGRTVIAEGVETAEHGLVLLQLGCDLAQGYGIARPMPAADLPGWAAAFRTDPLWDIYSGFSWRREDLPILTAEFEHRRWVDRVTACVQHGDSSSMPSLDSQDCRFGKWYAGPEAQRYWNLEGFRDIGPLHEQIHACGSELIALVAAGRSHEASARLPELHALRDQLLERVHNVQASVLMGL